MAAYDWKVYPKGWKYKSLKDPKYIEDRDKLIKEHGNGWWILADGRKISGKRH